MLIVMMYWFWRSRGRRPVAAEVAKRLKEPLAVVRKLGPPDRSELAIGAIASGGVRVTNRAVVEGQFRNSPSTLLLHSNKKNSHVASAHIAAVSSHPLLNAARSLSGSSKKRREGDSATASANLD
jgi:predicted phosphoribosyltransferase